MNEYEKLKKRCVEIAGSDWGDIYKLIKRREREAVEGFIDYVGGEFITSEKKPPYHAVEEYLDSLKD